MREYLKKLKGYSPIRFILTVALIAFFIKIPFGILGSIIVDLLHLNNPINLSVMQEPTLTIGDTILAVAIAPFIETIIGQIIPISLVMKIMKSKKWAIIISAGVFMTFHYPVYEFFPSAFAIGALLSLAWMVKKDEIGYLKAFIMISLIHSLHNVLVALSSIILT